MKKDTYILGTRPVPKWCERLLSPYRRFDGSVGYEFHGKTRDLSLSAGDALVREGGYIRIVYRKEE